MLPPPLSSLNDIFGNIDIYLFDQLLKGRIKVGMKLLDAGCGSGRNITYLLQTGVEAYGVDASTEAVGKVQQLAAGFCPNLPLGNFIQADLSALPYTASYFDAVLCSAVLHFAKDETHFTSMVQELWRVLQPGGMLFCRMGTTIGMEGKLVQVSGHHYQMRHGPVWFLADEALLQELENRLEAERLEPLKTVVVEHDRSMTTWVLRKKK